MDIEAMVGSMTQEEARLALVACLDALPDDVIAEVIKDQYDYNELNNLVDSLQEAL